MVKPVYLMGPALTVEASTDVITAYRTTSQKPFSGIFPKLGSLFIFNVLLTELSSDRHVRVREHEQAAILGNVASFFRRVSSMRFRLGEERGPTQSDMGSAPWLGWLRPSGVDDTTD